MTLTSLSIDPTEPRQGFSIRVASRLSGISADTLRMWERRYGFPCPIRNDQGVRVYEEGDVERLVLVSRAMKLGYRAGEAIRLEVDALKELLSAQSRAPADPLFALPAVDRLMDLLSREEVDALRLELRQLSATEGSKRFITEVAGPLLERVGTSWAGGELGVRHEHLIAEVLSSHLRFLAAQHDGSQGPCVLLATLPRETHGLGLEMVSVYLAVHGLVVRTLGTDTPPQEIAEAAESLGASAVGVSVSLAAPPTGAAEHLRQLAELLAPERSLWVGGKGAERVTPLPERAELVVEWAALDAAIARMGLR